MFEKRIHIFTGHFGSGKSEVAVNYAVQMSDIYNKTAVVDFDIVNPYFRTTDVKFQLEQRGIKVVTPLYANTNVDVPSLPPEINTLFEVKEYKVVFDVGGDDLGAKAVSRYREEILSDDVEMFFVINTRRPMTNTAEKIEGMIHEIEHSSRIKVTKLVNNTNLLQDTAGEDILQGHQLIQSVSTKLGIPIGFTSGFRTPIHSVESQLQTDILHMDKQIKLPWQS